QSLQDRAAVGHRPLPLAGDLPGRLSGRDVLAAAARIQRRPEQLAQHARRRLSERAPADDPRHRRHVEGLMQSPKDFVCNGSLIGWNAYAERIGCGYEEPMQASFVIDERGW